MPPSRPRRVLIITSAAQNHTKICLSQVRRLGKGLVRLGHDVACFDYRSALMEASPIKSKAFARWFCKPEANRQLVRYARAYEPQIIVVGFPRDLDPDCVDQIREAVPAATLVGMDGDPWPDRVEGRIATGAKLDIVTATNNGDFLDLYRRAGAPVCCFLPNMCDPLVEYRYSASDEWRSDLLWTGKTGHDDSRSDPLRGQIVGDLAARKNARLYGCLGRPHISGIDYLRAISGAKIGVSVNAINTVPLYHSDRLTLYAACGTLVLAKRVPFSDVLFEDSVHVKYFDTAEEFSDLADWYLKHEEERSRIAMAGMERAHTEFNGIKMAGYLLELVDRGSYQAPWSQALSTAPGCA